ncbi:MAG: chemotaxis protein CheB [Desulfatibacillaceae bacterium]|nr:chemotaxis protein CheB [Desulfatibacillaceae bacterium]
MLCKGFWAGEDIAGRDGIDFAGKKTIHNQPDREKMAQAQIQVLVIAQEDFARQLIGAIIMAEPDLEPAALIAADERAWRKCDAISPDVVVLAVDEQDKAAQTIKAILSSQALPIICLVESKQNSGPEFAPRLTDAGALAVFGLPKQVCGPLAEQLVVGIRAMAGVKMVKRRPTGQKPKPITSAPLAAPSESCPRISLVVAGASTGGPQALAEILSHLPADFPAPVVVVQHMSPGFLDGLARWLNRLCALDVVIPQKSLPLSQGKVYLAPEGRQATIVGGNRLLLEAPLPHSGHCPSIDALFFSAAKTAGSSVAGILCTGMGQDGAKGLEALLRAGAVTICQDEASSTVFGMNREAIALGAARFVLPPHKIGPALLSLVRAKKH